MMILTLKNHSIFSNRLIFEPPQNIKHSFYRCDNKFYLDECLSMYMDHKTYGVIYTNGKTCLYYELCNNRLKKINTSNINLIGKFKNGGQSQNRLRHIRENNREFNITRLAEKVVNIYYDKPINKSKVCDIIFCGPARFKIELSNHRLIKKFFDNNNIHTFNCDTHIELSKLNNYIDMINDPIERKHIDDIKNIIANEDDKLVFGNDIQNYLSSNMLSILYIHDTLIDKYDMNNVSHKTKIIILNSDFIMFYNGSIGIKWY